ncbi:hypothetical protein Pelo_19708 [Pelomyxa schiedti]|nr:hypothetical protein Pelo_19708 [Pelomyxa schiedti]
MVKIVVGQEENSVITIDSSGHPTTLTTVDATHDVQFLDSGFIVPRVNPTTGLCHNELWKFSDSTAPNTDQQPTHWATLAAAHEPSPFPHHCEWFSLGGELVIARKPRALPVIDLASGQTIITLNQCTLSLSHTALSCPPRKCSNLG